MAVYDTKQEDPYADVGPSTLYRKEHDLEDGASDYRKDQLDNKRHQEFYQQSLAARGGDEAAKKWIEDYNKYHGWYQSPGEKVDADDLRRREETGDSPQGQGLYNKHDREDRKGYRKEARQFVKVSKKQGLFGGITGLILGGVFFGMSFSAGPAGFIHMAQLESHAHDSSQQNESNDRFTTIVKYLWHYNKGTLEKTRLGITGRTVLKQYKGALAEKGILVSYDKLGNQTVAFDKTKEPWKDKSVKQIQDYVKDTYNSNVTVVEDGPAGKGVPQVNLGDARNSTKGAVGKVFADFDRVKFLNGVVNDAGYGKTLSLLGKRLLIKESGATFTPISKAKALLLAAATAAVANRNKGKDVPPAEEANQENIAEATAFNQQEGNYEQNGITADPISVDNEDNSQNDPKGANAGNASSVTDGANEVLQAGQDGKQAIQSGAPDGTDQATKSLKDTVKKIGGGGVAIVGLACILRGIDSNSDKINQAEVVVPLIRIATEAISLGSQVQSADNLSGTIATTTGATTSEETSGTTQELKQFGQRMYDPSDKSIWTDAAPVRALEGENPADGKPVPPEIADITKGTPFHFLNTGSFGDILKPVCGVLQGLFKIPIIGTVLNLANFTSPEGIFQYFAIGQGAKTVARWVSAIPIDATVAGADFGSYVDYGAKLAANQTFITAGAKKLSAGETKKLTGYDNSLDQQDFNSHSLAYRLFNTGDYRSFISRIMDKETPSPTQNLARIGGSLTNIGKLLASDVSSLFFSTVSADSTTDVNSTSQTYDYNLPTYGFSLDELNSSLVADPFQNANDVADILTQNAAQVAKDPTYQPNYVQQAQDCFMVQLTSTPDATDPTQQIWDSNANQDDTATQVYNPSFQSSSNSDKCAGDTTDSSGNLTITDTNWFKIRFFIFDTQTMKQAACYGGDDQSCSDIGMPTDGGSSSTTSSDTTIDPTTLYQDSSSVPCASGTSDEGIQDGYYNNQLVKIHTCGLPNIVATGSAAKTTVNARVSGAFYAMGQAARSGGVPLYADSSFRTMAQQEALYNAPHSQEVAKPGTSNHQMGLAIDFTTANGGNISGTDIFTWLTNNASKFGIKNYPPEPWHWSPTGN